MLRIDPRHAAMLEVRWWHEHRVLPRERLLLVESYTHVLDVVGARVQGQ